MVVAPRGQQRGVLRGRCNAQPQRQRFRASFTWRVVGNGEERELWRIQRQNRSLLLVLRDEEEEGMGVGAGVVVKADKRMRVGGARPDLGRDRRVVRDVAAPGQVRRSWSACGGLHVTEIILP